MADRWAEGGIVGCGGGGGGEKLTELMWRVWRKGRDMI